MTQLRPSTGRSVISAARDSSYEGYHDHGVLTYALLEGLDIKAAPYGDERVRVAEFGTYVEARVPESLKRLSAKSRLQPHGGLKCSKIPHNPLARTGLGS